MIVLAIDPGPETSGVVLYDSARKQVLVAHKDEPVAVTLQRITVAAAKGTHIDAIACERVQSYGISGGHLLRTAEVFGRVWDRAEVNGFKFVPMPRRDVLRELDLLGVPGNRDSAVRQCMIDMHGYTKRAACGVKSAPGPLYGVSSHAWQALGLAVAVAQRLEDGRA